MNPKQVSTYHFPNSGTSLPRAASLLSTDYGFNEWGFENDAVKVAALQQTPLVPQPGGGQPPDIHFNSLNSAEDRQNLSGNQSKLSRVQPNQYSFSNPGDKNFGSGANRAMSMNTVNHLGIQNNGTVQRGKSVRFGENRISVFMQDSTQALEECVRLALSYAEETKRGDYCSDSEAVNLSRTLNQATLGAVLLYIKIQKNGIQEK